MPWKECSLDTGTANTDDARMQWPFWISSAIGTGVAAVTTFAEDALPDHIRVIGFWIGVLLMVIGVAGMLWHLTAWYRNPIQRDTPLDEAVAYVVLGTWGRDYSDAVLSGQAKGTAEYDDVLQAAADGEIPVWGQRSQGAVYEAIPAEYWRDHWVDWWSLVEGLPFTARDAAMPHYERLMTSKAAVQMRWPRD